MEKKIYTTGLPDGARIIREEVFQKEQGFHDEFDEVDDRATHIVLFGEQEQPVATCRIFADSEPGCFILGRMAVIKEYRGKGLGATVIKAAEEYISTVGGGQISLHAQCRAAAFYEKLGYSTYGEADEDEGCPHIWMRKEIRK